MRVVPWPLLVAAAVLLSGCTVPDDPVRDRGGDAPATLPALVFGDPVSMIAGEGYGYEPSISVGPDRTLYMTAHKASLTNEGTQLSSWFKFSKDNGTTWQDMPTPGNVHKALYAFEGDIAIDDTGRIYMLDTWAADNAFHVWTTGEEGPVWERSSPVQGTVGVDDRPWLDAHGDGIVYYIGNNGGALPAQNNVLAEGGTGLSRIWFYRSTDAGLTWTPGHGFAGSGWCGLDANKADTQVVMTACNVGHTIYAYVSHDRGDTFEKIEVADYERSLSVPVTLWIDSDTAGNTYLFWIDRASDDGPAQLFFARSTDLGATWSVHDLSALVPEEVRADGLDKPWISAGSEGVVGMTFFALLKDREGLEDGWYAKAIVAADALAPRPTWSIARVSEEPSRTMDPVLPGGTSDPPAPGDFFENAIGPDDVLHVVFHGVPDSYDPTRPDSELFGDFDMLYARQTAGPNLEP